MIRGASDKEAAAPIKSVEAVLGAEGYDVGAAEMFRYAAEAEKELERQGLSKLFFEVEQPLVPVLAAMEERGIAVDAAKLDELKIKYEGKLPALAGRRICRSGNDVQHRVAQTAGRGAL